MLTSVTITKADIDGFLQKIMVSGKPGMFLHDFPADAHSFSFTLRKDGSFLIVYESSSDLLEGPAPAFLENLQKTTLDKAAAGLTGE